MKSVFYLVFSFLLISIEVKAQIFVSVDGNDSNPGSINQPYKSITKAISIASAGDTIFVRGGNYILTSKISIGTSKNGTSSSRYYLLAYQGERPILDFSSVSFGTRGIELNASYWYIKGFDIAKAGDNGMIIKGSENIIEFCSFYENKDTGLQLGGGASNNKIINCDSYYNADPDNGNADGFAPKLDVGTGNYFYGCRAWQNSDDGWDGYLRGANNITTTLENCWCFKNGYLKDGKASSGNGNGYKLGGGDNSNSANLMHHFILKNCIAFENRIKGFDQNNNKGSMTLLNCTGHNNGTNYKITLALNTGEVLMVKNCLAVGSYGSLGSFAVQEKNSWLSPFIVTNEDFISLNTAEAYGERQEDGSLPNIEYLHLTAGSDLIDSGVDVGISFNGIAPDIGAFESSDLSVPVELISFYALSQDYSVTLHWETTTELNNDGFSVERSVDKILWKEIAFIQGKGMTTLPQKYFYTDKMNSKNKLFYRLKQLDNNGNFEYSRIIEVNINPAPTSYSLNNYPNPFNPETQISFELPISTLVDISVYNLIGEKVGTIVNEFLEAGVYQKTFNAGYLSSGVYMYRLSTDEMTITNKMILAK